MFTLPLRPFLLRLAFLLALAVALTALGSFLVRAAIGDSLATFVQRSADLSTVARRQGADAAVGYATRDPLAHFRRGMIYLSAASEEQSEAWLSVAVAELREAARLSQEDYRIWIELGRALDRSGAQAEARAALGRAIELAPRHFNPHWVLGNHWLRAGEREAAFAELRVALARRPSELPLIFEYAWNAYQGDVPAIVKALETPLEARVELVSLLIARARVDAALNIWRGIAKPTAAQARIVTRALLSKQRFASAYEVWRTSAPDDVPSPDAGSQLSNGGFESEIVFNATQPFLIWQIKPPTDWSVSRDGKEHKSGAYSLRVGFDLKGNPELTVAVQTVMVAPATAYRLSFAAQTEELRNLSPPFVEIYDAANQQRLHAESKPIMTEKKEWRDYSVEFTTTPATEAVTVRIGRRACGDPPCPLRGRIWFDDFQLGPRTK